MNQQANTNNTQEKNSNKNIEETFSNEPHKTHDEIKMSQVEKDDETIHAQNEANEDKADTEGIP